MALANMCIAHMHIGQLTIRKMTKRRMSMGDAYMGRVTLKTMSIMQYPVMYVPVIELLYVNLCTFVCYYVIFPNIIGISFEIKDQHTFEISLRYICAPFCTCADAQVILLQPEQSSLSFLFLNCIRVHFLRTTAYEIKQNVGLHRLTHGLQNWISVVQ